VLPAFVESPDEDTYRYEPSVEAFLDSDRVLVVTAFDVQFLHDGGETYGLDTAVEAFINLAGDLEGLQMAIFIARRPSRPKARRHLAKLERRLEQEGLRERVLILFGLPLVSALRRNAIFIRPTRAEGDAVSIREAQQAGVPVVASDVTRRPEGVVSFPTESVQELCAALRSLLDGSIPHRKEVVRRDVQEPLTDPFFNRLVRIYRTELMSQARARR
jgi:glycosyltransferase involved in cell wall biosynthesis